MASHRAVYVVLLLYINTIHSSASAYKVLNNYEFQCQENTCVPKCCPEDYVVKRSKHCMYYPNKNLDFSDLKVYDVDVTKPVSRKEILIMPSMFKNDTFKNGAVYVTSSLFNVYLTEAGFLYLESPNSFPRWFKRDSSQFCVDYAFKRNTEPMLKMWVILDDLQESHPPSPLSTYAKSISCIFLLLVLIMFPLVPANRDLNGIMLLNIILNLFIVFVLLNVMTFSTMLHESCLGFTFSIYFFYIASFCWITAIAYNTWRTFRDYDQAQSSRRTNGIRKMLVYSAFAWGLPLILTICIAVVNSLNLRETMPWLIQPNVPNHGCFIDGAEKTLYLFVPSLMLLLASVIFYLLAAQYIFGLKRRRVQKPGSGDVSVKFQTDYRWFKVQVAMVVVMVFHCLLEMAGSLTTDISIMYISDIYGLVWGPLLFFVLIIYYYMLRKRLPTMSQPAHFQNNLSTYKL